MILQADKAEDWVIASGKTTSVRDFVKMSFAHIGVSLKFIGEGLNEVEIVRDSTNPDYKVKIVKRLRQLIHVITAQQK